MYESNTTNLIFLSIIGCNKPITKDGTKVFKTDALISRAPIKKRTIDLTIKKYNLLMMYNEKYVLQIVPDSTKSIEEAAINVLLTKKLDTVFNYPINIDTINIGYKKFKRGTDKKMDYKENYYLTEIEGDIGDIPWVRSDNLYLGVFNIKKR